MLVPKLLNVGPGRFAGDPASSRAVRADRRGPGRLRRRRRDFAIQCHRSLHGNQRRRGSDVLSKSLIQNLCFLLKNSGINLYPRGL